MPVTALVDYDIAPRDALANFHGNQLVYFHWEDHLSFCAAIAFPLPPAMPFAAVTGELLPAHYGSHPDWARVDWANVRWQLDGKPLAIDPTKSLAEHGVGHKSLLQFWT